MEQAKSIWLQAPKAAGTVGKGLLAAAAVLLAALLSLAVAAPAWAANGTWKEDSTGWWYQRDDGSYPANRWELVGGQWYYFEPSGYMATDWRNVGGTWYWLGSDGAMRTGWYTVDGEWQWSDSSGAWKANTWEYSNGRWWYSWADGTYPAGSWQLIGGEWYYFDDGGYMATGWQLVGPDWYYLDGSGAMATGWVSDGGGWYYLKGSGAMATGWQLVGDDWYFLRSGGSMVSDGWVDGTYWMGASGAMATSEWVDGGRYYVRPDGRWVEGHEPITAPVTPASDFDYAIGDYILNGEVKTGVVPAGYTKMFGCQLSTNPNMTYTERLDFNALKGSDCGYGVYVTGYHGDSDTVVVPNEINGVPVVYVNLVETYTNFRLDVSRCSSLRCLYAWGLRQLELGKTSNLRFLMVQDFFRADYVDCSPASNLSFMYSHGAFPAKFDMATAFEFFGSTLPELAFLYIDHAPRLRELVLVQSGLSNESFDLGDCPELRFLDIFDLDLSAFTKAKYPNLVEVNGERV